MADPILDLDNVTVRRGMGVVLENFSLSVSQGECVLLHGDNGIGKSTIIETAARLLPLESGSVRHHGLVVCDGEGRRAKPKHNFGLTLQKNCLVPSQTVQERLDNVAALCNKSLDMTSIIESYKIGNRRNDQIANLSGGQQRKVAVISGLLPGMISKETRLILLDEPDSGLDDDSVECLVKQIHMLRNLGHAIVIASHDVRLRECATKLYDFNELKTNEVSNNLLWQVESNDYKNTFLMTKIGWKLNFETLVSIQTNWLAALLVMGVLLSIADPLTLSENRLILMGFALAPAFAMGLVGDSVLRILQEQRSVDWWRAQNNILPNSYIETLVSGAIISALGMQIFLQSIDYRIILIGGLICLSTSYVVRFLQLSTIRLARANAVFIRLLTPVLILPWGIIVDYCAKL
ncbi:MAG: ATP-binding cassette domain-containing protein [Candidatus Thermoplasmatota archaeon]|nr:ATP-binding cassette domain-containing protein [Candidatus Thermoplasmatota archaeon]